MSITDGKQVNIAPGVVSRLSDEELVRLVMDGNLAAFDELVIRYRQVVLHTARALLGDWEQGEDVAQQSLLEAFRCLPGLQDASRFRAWLMVITRRCALRRRMMRGPEMLEFSEAVIYPLARPTAANDDTTERVKEYLLELSSRSRQVITLHYLDGYSCKEIGQRLHIPAGTVKRILHDSRNSLRAVAGVSKGDHELMDTVSSAAQKHKGPRDLAWWINGWWDGSVIRSALSRSICLTINKTPRTVEEISRDVEAHSRYVLEALNPLVEEGLVTQLPDGRYLDQFIVIDAEDWIVLMTETRRRGSLLADAVVPHLPALEEAWNRTTLPGQGFTWADGIWPTLAAFICSTGIVRHNPLQPDTPIHASGNKYSLGCHETIEPKYDSWGVGFNENAAAGDSLAYGYWWTPAVNRPYHAFGDEHDRVLGAVGKGAVNAEAVAERTSLPLERTRGILAEAIELGIVTKRSGKLAVAFPIIREPDSEALYPTVDAVAAQLTTEILLPSTAETGEQLKAMGYGQQESQFPVWRLWMESYVAGECLHELVRRGILPDPGDPVPANFCMVGWYAEPNPPRVMTWRI